MFVIVYCVVAWSYVHGVCVEYDDCVWCVIWLCNVCGVFNGWCNMVLGSHVHVFTHMIVSVFMWLCSNELGV